MKLPQSRRQIPFIITVQTADIVGYIMLKNTGDQFHTIGGPILRASFWFRLHYLLSGWPISCDWLYGEVRSQHHTEPNPMEISTIIWEQFILCLMINATVTTATVIPIHPSISPSIHQSIHVIQFMHLSEVFRC